MTSSALKEALHSEGINLVGIADATTILLASPPRPATDLMPAARSVVVMAVAHSLGAVCAPDIRMWTRNKIQTSRLLDQAAERLARELEKEGFLSYPVSADKPVEIHKADRPWGSSARPRRLSQWPAFLAMLLRHSRRRDILVESGQIFITDVDFCMECMKACPVGERWERIRPGGPGESGA